jgi:hypothetical protein
VALERDCPGLGELGPELAEAVTVGDLVDRVRPHARREGGTGVRAAADPPAEESTDDSAGASSTVEVLVATETFELRRDPRNRVLESVVGRDGRVEAALRVDESHPFYFDHPYDHVPGVLFVEAVQQLSEWLASALGGESLRRRLQLSELGMRFESWGGLDTPLRICAESVTRTGEAWRVRGSIGGKRRCARFDGLFHAVELESPGESSSEASAPAPGRVVHKRRPENVLISEPRMAGDAVVATALSPGPGHSLRDGSGECVPVTQLAEWTRQFLTARAHLMEQESFDEHFILLSVRVRLQAAVAREEPLVLWSPAVQSVDTPSLRVGGSNVELRRGDRTLGRIELFGAAADAEGYERARWGNRA